MSVPEIASIGTGIAPPIIAAVWWHRADCERREKNWKEKREVGIDATPSILSSLFSSP
jgi:hypothetical protein